MIYFNTGVGMFDMLTQLGSKQQRQSRIGLTEYRQWQKQFSFDALRSQRYGQSFCNYFNITDNRIFYDSDVARCDRLIFSEWVDA